LKSLIDLAVTYSLVFLGFLTENLSIRNRAQIGRLLGRFLMQFSKTRRIIALENIKNAFPEKTDAECQRIMTESFENLSIITLELLSFKSKSREEFDNHIRFSNLDLINDIYNQGNGIIFLSAHYGNWELVAYTISLFTGLKTTLIVKNQRNKFLNEKLNTYRTYGGNTIVSMKKAARTVVKELQKGHAIALMVDQSADKQKDVYIEFFGRKVPTFESPAALSLKFKCPIIIGFAVRQADDTYIVESQKVPFEDLEFNKEGIEELTLRHTKILESAIRENPGLWAWQHRRWKYAREV